MPCCSADKRKAGDRERSSEFTGLDITFRGESGFTEYADELMAVFSRTDSCRLIVSRPLWYGTSRLD